MWQGQKCLQELLIENWQKFNSNSGWADEDDPWPRVMQALSHYSYHITAGECVLCDLQGGFCSGGVVPSDPVILSQKKQYGVTDLGKEGISTFFSRHRCNKFCRPEWSKPHKAVAHFPAQQGTTMVSHTSRPQRAAGPGNPPYLQAFADGAAARTPAQKKADGKNTNTVNSAVMKALSGKAKVIRAGSDKKRVDIAGSDIDLLVDTGNNPVTVGQTGRLVGFLRKGFPDAKIRSLHPTSIHIYTIQGRDIDVVLKHIPGNTKPLPREHFKNNPRAQTAIRAFKGKLALQGKKVQGRSIENAVIDFTQGHRGCTDEAIYKHLKQLLSQGKLKSFEVPESR